MYSYCTARYAYLVDVASQHFNELFDLLRLTVESIHDVNARHDDVIELLVAAQARVFHTAQ